MKRASLAILFCLLLSACVVDPVFDASSWEALQRSTALVKSKLSNDELRRLDIALKYLSVESAPVVNGSPLNSLLARASLINPDGLLIRLRPAIHARTASGVIANLASKLDAEISEVEARMPNADQVLGSVEVHSPRYYWRRSGFAEQPVIEFSVYNGGKSPITRVYISGTLTSPSRSLPWVKQEFIQTFRGGLEPREKQRITMEPRYGEWNDRQFKYLFNAELKMVVTNFEDANGQKVLAIGNDRVDQKRKVRAALQ